MTLTLNASTSFYLCIFLSLVLLPKMYSFPSFSLDQSVCYSRPRSSLLSPTNPFLSLYLMVSFFLLIEIVDCCSLGISHLLCDDTFQMTYFHVYNALQLAHSSLLLTQYLTLAIFTQKSFYKCSLNSLQSYQFTQLYF